MDHFGPGLVYYIHGINPKIKATSVKSTIELELYNPTIELGLYNPTIELGLYNPTITYIMFFKI